MQQARTMTAGVTLRALNAGGGEAERLPAFDVKFTYHM